MITETYKFLESTKLFQQPAMGLSVSKMLGCLLVAVSLVSKVSQIVNIYKNRGVTKLNIFNVSLELVSTTIYMSYNFLKGFPFASWAEPLFMSIQTLIIALEILFFDNDLILYALMYLIAYIAFFVTLLSGYLGKFLMTLLQSINVLILLSAKCVQIYNNYKNGHIGPQRTSFTPFFAFCGCLIRVYTSIYETRDPLTICANLAGTVANFVLLYQLVGYWKVNPKTIEEEQLALLNNTKAAEQSPTCTQMKN